ncbi:Putative metal-dependent protease of the PAD1/JAB1 superfamily (fragment) [metagenome]
MVFKIKKSKEIPVIKKIEREIKLKKEVLDSILSYCQIKHPNEGILILRGKSKKGDVYIDGLIIPPFAFNAHSSSGFPHYMLPADISYVALYIHIQMVMHSHQ